MLINKVTHIDADPEKNIAEDFATVSGCVFGYGKSIPTMIPVSFVVRNKHGMEYFEGLDASSSNVVFTKVWGSINCMTIKVEKTEESAWGEAAVQSYERKSREYLITGTAKVPYDFGDEDILTAEDVIKMSQDREVMLSEVEQRYKERKSTSEVNFASNDNPVSKVQVPAGQFVF